jgi:hypothetical protein
VSLADSIALTTLETVLAELGATPAPPAPVLEREILVASQAIGNFLQRTLRKGTATEKLHPKGLRRLVLPQTPLVSITSIALVDSTGSSTPIDATLYSIEDAAAGIVIAQSPFVPNDPPAPWSIDRTALVGLGDRSIVVTYVGGYVLPNDTGTRDLPYDIEEACILTVVSLERARGADRRVVAESLGDYSVRLQQNENGLIPDEAAALLAPYRRVVMA